MELQIQRDTSWLCRNQTIEEADFFMQKSISQVACLDNLPCVWVADLAAGPTRGVDKRAGDMCFPLERSGKKQRKKAKTAMEFEEPVRVRNSFMQYRTVVQHCFPFEHFQPAISRQIAQLWATESQEMRFLCERNAAIESRITSDLL